MSKSWIKILLVQSDTSLGTALKKVLQGDQWLIEIAMDEQAGLDLATRGEYDLILLDVEVPKLNGIRLCRQLRTQGNCKPILLVTAKDSDADVLAGLDAGADDYISKPYTPDGLLVKIRTLLHRNGVLFPEGSTQHPSTQLTWGNLCLNLDSGRVTLSQQVIPLTATEFKVLELFLQNPDRIFSRGAILDRLWGFDDSPSDRAIITHIKDLRKKLKAGGLTEEIIETVYGMGYRLKPYSATSTSKNYSLRKKQYGSDVQSRINSLLERFRGVLNQQVEVLERARNALLVGNLDSELQKLAQQEAHKLTGSLATFGYYQGSKLARVAEMILLKDSSLTAEEITQFSERVTALREELRKPPATLITPLISTPAIYRVLVVDDDTALTERLQAEATAWGFQMTVAPDLTIARSCLAQSIPDVILLDLSFPATEENGLTLLKELREQFSSSGVPSRLDLPILVFTGQDTLATRLAVSRLGARQFLHKPATPEQIFRSLMGILPNSQKPEAKVLIVDDDAVILQQLSALLTPWGLEVITLTEPQEFWQILNTTLPNLVILDLEMPQVSGLELCQVVRQDIYWGDLPILVVTAHLDGSSLQQAFAAGADDFITKPVLGPELVTRVLSQIERHRCRR